MASNFIAKGADGYEAFMGRWSKRLAPVFLDFAGIRDGERVLDVGCGTGSLTFSITERSDVASIEAIDFEEPFVEALRQQNKDPRITARQGDACALTFEDRQFDRALSLLVLHFVSDPAKAISEMRRVVRPGGVVAATVWDTFGGMPSQRMFWDTFCAIEPAAVERRSLGLVRPMTRPGELAKAFAAAGLEQVTEAFLTIRMDFRNFDDYWQPLINGQGTLAAFLSTLPATTTDRLQASVRDAYLCGGSDGARSFPTTAVAVKATVPQG
jgi:ubiquinone/menaquinone biosynthesis C-methylase UbiE